MERIQVINELVDCLGDELKIIKTHTDKTMDDEVIYHSLLSWQDEVHSKIESSDPIIKMDSENMTKLYTRQAVNSIKRGLNAIDILSARKVFSPSEIKKVLEVVKKANLVVQKYQV